MYSIQMFPFQRSEQVWWTRFRGCQTDRGANDIINANTGVTWMDRYTEGNILGLKIWMNNSSEIIYRPCNDPE